MIKPLVSICCTAYNHSNFIKDCLEGFLMQKTDFDFEILIHDDASTDGTQGIIKAYQEKYPEIIKPILQTKNQYSKGVKPLQQTLFPKGEGKYIALCEGDDYWTDPLKLQKQVDFLEENEDYSMCFHKAEVISDGIELTTNIYDHLIEKEYTGEEILLQWTVPTASVMFKNEYDFESNIKPLNGLLFGDILLFLFLASKGRLYCLEDKMSVYRRNESGVSVKGKFTSLDKLNHYKALYKILSPNFETVLENLIAKYLVKVINQNLDTYHYKYTLKYSVDLIRLRPKVFKNKVLKKRLKRIL